MRYIFCSITMVIFLFFTACDRVVVTSADELLLTERYAQTASGMKARLCFSDGEGELKIEFPTGENAVSIKGVVSVDEEKFYITSKEFGKTYAFSYKVFTDRAEITYGSQTLNFYPVGSECKTE